MVFDIVNEAVLTIHLGVKAEAGMGRYQLKWIFLIEVLGMMTFPGRNIFRYGRPFGIIRIESFQTRAFKFQLPGLCLKPHQIFFSIV